MASVDCKARLQRDLRELQRAPVENVGALPLENDICEWHANMLPTDGNYKGLMIHMVLKFPSTYPADPPHVHLCTRIIHPNVFSWGICLDMLQPSYSKGQGWSSAYSVRAILMQLYGFLLVDTKLDQDWGGSYDRCIYSAPQLENVFKHAKKFVCRKCSHRWSKPWPMVQRASAHASSAHASPTLQQRAGHNAPLHIISPASPGVSSLTLTSFKASNGSRATVTHCNGLAGGDHSFMDSLDDAVLLKVLEQLPAEDLHRCQKVSERVAGIATVVLRQSELICYFSKLDIKQCTLGFGIQRHWHRARQGTLSGLSSPTEFLSWEAFQVGVSNSVWNEQFECFLPLYINPRHGEHALKLLPRCVNAILNKPVVDHHISFQSSPHTKQPSVCPSDMLLVSAHLLNSLVVDMVKLGERGNNTAITRGMCDASLSAFCHLHHLLLSVALQPKSGVLSVASQHVASFVASRYSQHKNSCPDLGLLLVKYLVTPRDQMPWSKFGPVLVRECLARQVLWAVRKDERFAQPQNDVLGPAADGERLKHHFNVARTSLRVLMLQAWFANAMSRPADLVDMAKIKVEYDLGMGLPAKSKFDRFSKYARQVLQCSNWTQFLAAMRLGINRKFDPKLAMVAMLRQAVVDSARAGYHTGSEEFWNRGLFMNWKRDTPLGTYNEEWE